MNLFTYTLLLISPIGQVFGQNGIIIKNAHSARRLYAQKNKSGGNGVGGAPKGKPFHADQRWNFKPATCAGDYSNGGPCYLIENSSTGRRLYARSGMEWENGVGASTGTTPQANQKWILEESDCGVNERCFFIINAKSGRRLYAQANKSWETGVGAGVGTKYDDQKWFIDIDLDSDFEEPCLDFESLDFSAGCEYSSIESVISANLGDCSHNVQTEVKTLARDLDFAQAKFKISNMCKGVETCLDSWYDIKIEGCTYKTILRKVKTMLPSGCEHNAQTELQYFTSSDSKAEMKDKIDEMCSNGWSVLSESAFTDIDNRFDDAFMDQYVDGKTFLNSETGSFKGTDVRNRIESFRDGGATSSVLQNVPALEDCALPSIMCCFGRDRQPNDNNGNCAKPLNSNCVNADPADNSNLCFLEDDTIFPGETEGDIHCHGLAWAEDDNDFTAQLRMNNFFYVSLYDHMSQRGYVESMVDSPDIPMCGCIEDMQPVSRSDCTEIDASLKFRIKFEDGGLVAVPGDNLKVEFNACKGTNFSNGNNQNNDLASYVNRLTNKKLISTTVRDEIFETLVGYAQPNNNENENACARAYESRTGGVYAEGIVITNAASGRRLYARKNQDFENGIGASSGTNDDNKWHFTSTDCEGTSRSGPCYEIVNAHSGRRLFAQKGKTWENGVGGSKNYVFPDQKWVLKETEKGGERAFFIINAYSGRRLYAQSNKQHGNGVGAGVGTKYDDQKWFIPIEDNFQII